MSTVNLSVAVNDDYLNRMSEVVQKLQAAGMKVEQVMETLGIITGSCSSEKVKALSGVEGVTHVERSREYQIAPPDSEIQ